MRRLTLPEYSRRAYAPLPRPTADALATTGAVRVGIDRAGRTVLNASSRVGVIRVGDVELRVTPKMPIRRLLWLLGYARDPNGWRTDDIVDLSVVDDLIAAVAISFLAAARRALAGGVLQGYRVTDEALPLLRGRLREADQFRARLGLAVPLEVRYDDYTIDIPENRLLLAAALRLLRVPGLPGPTRTGLHRILSTLADVTPLVSDHTATADDRLTRRYQPALRLAHIVLAGQGIDQPPGPMQASGFLFDLNKAFEDWFTATLRRCLTQRGGQLHDQYRTHLDESRDVDIRPDLIWEVGGSPHAILDAKYKRTKQGSQHHPDLYQMLAYCTTLGLPDGHLVYASGGVEHTCHVVRRAGTRIHVWALDLSQPVPGLLAQVGRLAQSLSL